jgi:RAD51-like protein 2
MVDLRALTRLLRPEHLPFVQFKRVMSLPELLLFFEQLEAILPSEVCRYCFVYPHRTHVDMPQDTLLYIASIAFPFQNPDISPARRSLLLQKVRQILAKATTTPRVTVVATSQLATKFVNQDGSPGNFETGTQGIMVPQLGSLYLCPSPSTLSLCLFDRISLPPIWKVMESASGS